MDLSPNLKSKDEIIKANFITLSSRRDIARMLEVEYGHLNYLLYILDDTKRYKKFNLSKKNGGVREILAPISTIKIIQRKLNYILSLIYEPAIPAHGFCAQKSIVTNANCHIKKEYVLNVDLKNFFPSINFGRVRGLFLKKPFNFNQEVATILAQICCHDNQLPQGAPTSPIVSNMICWRLDRQLSKLAKETHCTYTRYADDITMSSNKKTFSKDIVKVRKDGDEIIPILSNKFKHIIDNNGFTINDQKVRLFHKTKRQEVVGLTVNNKTNIRRKFIRQVRAMLYAWSRFGLANAEKEYYERYCSNHKNKKDVPKFSTIVGGKINFIKDVKGEINPIYRNFKNQFNLLMNNNKPELPVGEYNMYKFSIWIVKSGLRQGTGVWIEDIGLITCCHNIVDDSNIEIFRCNDVGKKYSATILIKDSQKDLAILTTQEKDIAKDWSLKISEKDLQVFDEVSTIGFPSYQIMDQPNITKGYIKSQIRDKYGNSRFRISSSVYGGESGGAVLDKNNKVIGIIVVGLKKQGIDPETCEFGFIPNSVIQELINEKIEIICQE